MLKRKLQRQKDAIEQTKPKLATLPVATSSEFFSEPFSQSFYAVECELNEQLSRLEHPSSINCTYNPVEYAAILHCGYLRHFLKGKKRIMFVGMNPGPNGMGQTGVPFGNVRTVRDRMQLSGNVLQPTVIHPKRPVLGLDCKTEEPSGVRLWELFERLSDNSVHTFAQQCFVHNFCPLAFFDAAGRNITPSELKGEYKKQIREICLAALDKLLQLVQPQFVVAVGEYVHTALKKSAYCSSVSLIRLSHPSPRALHNTDWADKATDLLQQHNLIRFMRNEQL